MSAINPAAPDTKPATIGQSLLVGRLTSVRKAGESMIHLAVLPAEDAYSSPQTVELIGKRRIGDVGEDVRVRVRIGGFRRQYRMTDKDTGEVLNRTTADNKLYIVDEV